jgi:hypothetical protein
MAETWAMLTGSGNRWPEDDKRRRHRVAIE